MKHRMVQGATTTNKTGFRLGRVSFTSIIFFLQDLNYLFHERKMGAGGSSAVRIIIIIAKKQKKKKTHIYIYIYFLFLRDEEKNETQLKTNWGKKKPSTN